MSSYSCIRWVFCWLNVILWISGGAIISLGIWLKITNDGLINLMPQFYYLSFDKIAIGIGCIIFILTFLGCCGSLLHNRCMLITYFIFIICLLVIEIISGTTVFVFRHNLSRKLKQELQDGILNHYNSTSEGLYTLPMIWDHIQNEFRCCGVQNYEDWYLINAWPTERWVPDSCCLKAVQIENCGKTDADNWYENGCLKPIYDWIMSRLTSICLVALCIIFLQLYGLISSMLLFCTIKHRRHKKKYSYRT